MCTDCLTSRPTPWPLRPTRAKLLRHLLAAIKLFEPRLANVRIVPLENSHRRVCSEFRLRIEATAADGSNAGTGFFRYRHRIEERCLPVDGRRQCAMICFSTMSGSWTISARWQCSFAEKHPKVASRLVLEPTKCEDPHVERLLEAFAFLAARVHLKIDDEFPEISEALLTVIYPQLVRPDSLDVGRRVSAGPGKRKTDQRLTDRSQLGTAIAARRRRSLHLSDLLRHNAVAGFGKRRGMEASQPPAAAGQGQRFVGRDAGRTTLRSRT